MLTKSSLNAAYPLAQKLASKGFALRALDQTPLSAVINACMNQRQVLAAGPKGMDTTECGSAGDQLLEGSRFTDPMGVCEHDEAMKGSVDLIKQAVEFNLNLARNVVNPIVKQVLEETQAYMDGVASAALAPMWIEPYYYKPIWDSPVLIELVSRYGNLPVSDYALRPLGLPQPASMLEALKTGAGMFDEDIAAFYDACGSEYVGGVWNAVFGASAATSLTAVLTRRYSAFDAAILVFLFARRLQEDIPAGVNMDLAEWKAYISGIQAEAGHCVVRALKKRQLDLRVKTLVFEGPVVTVASEAKGAICVVGDVYDQFIKEGGSPEVLFGAYASGSSVGYNDLLSNKAVLLKNWQRAYALLQSEASFNRFNGLVGGLRSAVTNAINNADEDILVVERSVLHERLKERLTHVKQKDLEDLYYVARKTVCRVMFPHTDAEQILLAIDASAAAHPELDIREAALLATIDFVSIWLAKLFTVESAPDTGL